MKWSVSAHNTFRRCQRQYLFGNVIAYWRGDPLRREAYVLKQLQGLEAWQGHLVEFGIENFILPGLDRGLPPAQEVIDKTLSVAQDQYTFSLAKRYRETGITKSGAGHSFCALFRHEYGPEVAKTEVDTIYSTVASCLKWLLEQRDLWDHLATANWLRPQVALNFPLAGANIKAHLDLLAFYAGDRSTIVDWKVVKAVGADHVFQLGTYALAVQRKWPQITLDKLRMLEVNPLKRHIKEHTLREGQLGDIEDNIYKSVHEIRALVGDASADDQRIDDFEVANSHFSCSYCGFRSMCTGGNDGPTLAQSLRDHESQSAEVQLTLL